MNEKIEIVNYDAKWEIMFLEEESKLQNILKAELIQCFHIGSTAVPNLKAKPIIDLLLVVKEIDKLDSFSADFGQLGYISLGENGIKARRFYYKGAANRTHHIHAFQYTNIYEIERHLLYRDYLRTHPEAREEYAALKQFLAKSYPNDRAKYSEGKDALVKKIERLALEWHWKSREN